MDIKTTQSIPRCQGGATTTFITLFLIFSIFSTVRGQSGTEGFYKDLFIDAGVHLGYNGHQEADSLGLSYEHVSGEDSIEQNWSMVSNPQDLNGTLLYPDGSPRFRLLYTNGGYGNHGRTLKSRGRRQIAHFFSKGGSYVGSCNGAALSGYGNHNYGLWTSPIHGTNVGDINTVVATSHYIPPNSPVRNYYSFPNYLHNISHSGGYYFPGQTTGLEVLGRYAGTDSITGHLNSFPGMVAYKANDSQGRLVVSGSHPEYAPPSYTDAKHLHQAFYLYALDGVGKPRLKANLSNGVAYDVDEVAADISNVSYSNYGRIKIGDKQYHHFKMTVPSGVPYLMVEVDGDAGYHLNVYARPGNEKVFASNATNQEVTVGADKLLLINNPAGGTWHFSVECATSVTATWNANARRYDYVEDVPGVLNGVGYTIKATGTHSAPNLSFSGLAANYCVNDPTVTLVGTPAGGTFSGPGIVGATFDPALAGVGTHTVTYSWYSLSTSQQVEVELGSGPAPVITGPSHVTMAVSNTHQFSVTNNPDVVDYEWSFGYAPFFELINYILDGQGRKTGIVIGKVCGADKGDGYNGPPPVPPVLSVTVTCTAVYCGGTRVSSTHTLTYDVAQYLAIGDPCAWMGGKKKGPSTAAFSLVPNPSSGAFRIEGAAAGQVRVLDLQGKVVYAGMPQHKRVELPTGTAPGLYFVQMRIGEDLVSRKLLIQ